MLERYTCMIPVTLKSARLRNQLAVDCLSRALVHCQTGQSIDDFILSFEGNQAVWVIRTEEAQAA